MGGDGQAIVHHIGGAWGNGLGVDQGTRRPGVAFVDLVAMLIYQEGAVEVCPGFHRPPASIGHRTAPEEHLPQVVHGFELDPDVKGIDGATGKEMTNAAVPYHHLYEHLRTALHRGGYCLEWGQHWPDLVRTAGLASAARRLLLADRKRGRQCSPCICGRRRHLL